jgi:hypothetical protein
MTNMLRKGTEYKYEPPYSGPHTILQVNTNGTVRLRVGSVTDNDKYSSYRTHKETPDPPWGESARHWLASKRKAQD